MVYLLSVGESGNEGSRAVHSEEPGNAGGGNKGESVGGRVSGDKEGYTRGRVSFRDKVVGNARPGFSTAATALEGDRLGTVIGKQGDPQPPRIKFTKETRDVFSLPYKDAVIRRNLLRIYVSLDSS
ncbi:hypothetical protein PIB30_045591 [Stylosanthes scabra]|uniref:Uncharacterized protein n=1 Tax=Stylosanthes scabra TaxID=79078 RepID=A0ABU6QGG3_9FABA|nr:hypothetical protein [Stylosanthes scabra]